MKILAFLFHLVAAAVSCGFTLLWWTAPAIIVGYVFKDVNHKHIWTFLFSWIYVLYKVVTK